MGYVRQQAWAGIASLLVAAALATGISAQKKDKDKDQKDSADPRPKVSLPRRNWPRETAQYSSHSSPTDAPSR